MKKLLSLTLAVLMLMTLMSCTQKKTTYEILTEAAEKTVKLDNYDADVELNLSFAMEGMTLSIPASMEIKASDVFSGSPKAYMNADISYMGMLTIDLALYYEKEYIYLSMMGETAKYNIKEFIDKITDEDISAESESYAEEYQTMLKNALAEVEAVENEDGSKTISYILSGELLKEIATATEASEELQSSEFEISDFEITQTVDKDGYITVSDIKFTISVTGDVSGLGATDSMQVDLVFDLTTTINNPGEPVEVTPMEGYESFEEVSPTEDMLEDFVPVM